MFFKQNSNIINAQVVRVKTDKLAKRALRLAKKKIKRSELIDSQSLGMYLSEIDGIYSQVIAEINNTTMVTDYSTVRAERMAETRKVLDFYDNDFSELKNRYETLKEKAKAADRAHSVKQDAATPPNVAKLRQSFEELANEQPLAEMKKRRVEVGSEV